MAEENNDDAAVVAVVVLDFKSVEITEDELKTYAEGEDFSVLAIPGTCVCTL
jgi:hypothetical protein